jgi:hypothetical protein
MARRRPSQPRQVVVSRGRAERGQAAVLLVGALLAVLVGGVVLGGPARGVGAAGDGQRAADPAALAGARAMHGAYFRLFEPPLLTGREPAASLDDGVPGLGRAAATRTAAASDAPGARVAFPGCRVDGAGASAG